MKQVIIRRIWPVALLLLAVTVPSWVQGKGCSTSEVNDDVVYFNRTPFNVENNISPTGHKVADRYISQVLFGEEYDNLQQAYEGFKALWKKAANAYVNDGGRKIAFSAEQVYKGHDSRFVCYHVTASLSGSVELTNLPKTEQTNKMRAQYFKISNGIDRYFIFDQQKEQVVGIDYVFVPAVAEKLKTMFGSDASLYAEDRCLQLLSKKGDGRFIFSQTTAGNFTDDFKELVGWNELGNIDTPAFLHGQKALEDYFRNDFSLATKDQKADTVVVTLIVREDGSIMQPTVENSPNYFNKNRMQELCLKMPKWMPAYENGQPVARETLFRVLVRKHVYEMVEQMPQFPGGQEELVKFIKKNLKYPKVCEELNIRGRVICSFVVENDGSISEIEVIKSVDPYLDKEAVRVVSLMPKWIPGHLKGSPVRVKYTMPITFNLK